MREIKVVEAGETRLVPAYVLVGRNKDKSFAVALDAYGEKSKIQTADFSAIVKAHNGKFNSITTRWSVPEACVRALQAAGFTIDTEGREWADVSFEN